jgi:hypothetical protein
LLSERLQAVATQHLELLMQDLEQVIRERAYHLWIADGCGDGNADAHWLSAQRDVLAASLENFARVKVSDTKDLATSTEMKQPRKVKTAPKTRGKRRAA